MSSNPDYQMQQYELHKKAFDTIIDKYNLKTEQKSTEIAELLTDGADGVNAGEFAEKFGMDVQEAIVFLEWIKVGIKFKQEAVDTAKASGFNNVAKQVMKPKPKTTGNPKKKGKKNRK